MDADLFLQQFGYLAQGEGGIKKLRDVILQLAVQGKLIAQSQADEPAQTLLKKINPKATKIDGLYEIPSNWVWAKLEAVSSYIQRGKGPTYSDVKQVPVVSQKCVQWRGFDFSLARFIDPETLQNYQEERFLVVGDLLWNSTGTGTLGRVCIYPGSDLYSKVVADSHVTIVRLNSLDPRYVWCFLASPIVQMNIEASGSTNQIELSTSTIKNHPVPIPPLAEQKRIVAKADELMALCDKLEAEQKAQAALKMQAVQSTLHHLRQAESLASFGTSLNILEHTFGNWFDDLATVKHLRATILQLAVQGKLVPQNPDDKPISLKGEKHKNLNWKYLKFLDVVSDSKEGFRRGPFGSALRKDFFVPNGIKVYEQKHAIQKTYKLGNYYIDNNKFAQMRAFEVISGDFIVSCSGTLGEIYQIPSDAPKGIINQALLRLRIDKRIFDHKYFEKYFYSPEFRAVLIEHAPGSAQVNMAGLKILKNLMLPVPPLAEQKRIVAKVDELMALCDQLESHIMQTQTLNTHLMDSLIHRMTEAA